MKVTEPSVTSKLGFYTTREAAQLLGISLRTAQLWVENGTLKAWKTEGGHRRISAESLQSLLANKDKQQTPGQSGSDQEPLGVLVLEDDPMLLRLYKTKIQQWGLPIRLHTASNGYEALILIGRHTPDLLITDLSMPNIDGFEVIRTIMRSGFREGLDIVVVTGMDSSAIEQHGGLPEGLLAVLPKPVPFDQLRQLTSEVLTRRAAYAAA